ncbi:MAG: DUF1549 and DUF1553 domain-containing protein [Lentisphaeraceae bacterium]|nr:DUF1549 and DUF1553 domain-containing protein [Lentisphaeraceae bacterium]
MKLKSFLLFLFLSMLMSLQADSQNILKMSKEIDILVAKKLKEIKQPFRKGIDDYTFCRRIYLNIAGRIPTFDELNKFTASKNKTKRSVLISSLLKSKAYNSNMYNYWADILRVKDIGDKLHDAGNYSQAIKSEIRENTPYDEFVRKFVGATGDIYKPGNGHAGYVAREIMQLDRLANTVKSFLGVSVECAQCHDHPFDEWTQKQFFELAAFTSEVDLKVDPPSKLEKKDYGVPRRELKKLSFDKWIVYREALRMKYAKVYGNGTGFIRLPHDYQYDDAKPHEVMQARVMFGSMPKTSFRTSKPAPPKKDISPKALKKSLGPQINAKTSLAEWMTSKENPMFTKATVNRLWKWIMGTELIGPVANLEVGAQGSHPALTNKLVEILQNVDFDTKKFFEVLLNTKTYQRRALSLNTKKPKYILDGPVIRRLSAQWTWDSMLSLRKANPDQYVPTKFHYDGFTHFYEKSQKWNVDKFIKYAKTSGHTRAKFYRAMHLEADKRNPHININESRASEYQYVGIKQNTHYKEVAGLFGASTREVIDGANTEPNIPQVLYMINGKPELDVVRSKSYLNKNIDQEKDLYSKANTAWLSILGRPISSSEKSFVQKSVKSQDDLKDMMWVLLNSNEFRFVR